MNTQDNTTIPTISQLWSRFDSIKYRFGSHEDYSKLIDLSRYAKPAQGRIDWVNEITSLRRQLVELCKLEVTTYEGKPYAHAWMQANLFFSEDDCREYGSALLFMAWELAQRKREGQQMQGYEAEAKALLPSTEDEVVTKCGHCDKNDAEEPHTCPYQEDINGDYTTLCNCCVSCQNDCASDI